MLTPDGIQAALCRPLPGRKAQKRMAPDAGLPILPLPDREPKQSGVLLLLYPSPETGDLSLLLTRRTETVADHKGQISFPGGGFEPHDTTVSDTAMREACEEVGVCSDDIRLLGPLTPLYIPPSNFCVHPFVAYTPYRPPFMAQPEEVAELLEVPLSHLLDERNVVEEEWVLGGAPTRVPFFQVHGHKVWGATAVVLAEFVAVLKGLCGDTGEEPSP